MVNNLLCVGTLGSIDHVLVLADLNLLKISRKYQIGKKTNMDRIKDSLNIDWKQKLEGNDTFSIWNEYKTLLNHSINNNVSMKKRRTKNK